LVLTQPENDVTYAPFLQQASMASMTVTPEERRPRREARLPDFFRAIVTGIAVALVAANVSPLLLLRLGAPLGSAAEAIFLGIFLWWTSGGGPPRSMHVARKTAFRTVGLSPVQWSWSLVAALAFAVVVHAAIVVLFRLVPFPTEAFRRGYDFSFIHSRYLRWLAVVISAASAGICEETGFRGYMQRPIELRHGAAMAIAVSSLFFMLLHLTKGWALIGMVPIVFGAGILLGLIAWSSGSLIPGMVGHTIMDIGLFGYWWTGIAGSFTARPIRETGLDRLFILACGVLAMSLFIVFIGIGRLWRFADFAGH
jgi:membrane protease YdiL (CAAX protease family)